MKISELKPKVGGVNLEFDVIEKGAAREFNKFGRSGKVCTAIAKDSSGQIKLSLWNEDCDKVNVGDKMKLTDGYVNEFQGEMQLTTGRAGKLEVVGKAEASAAPKAAEAAPEKNTVIEPEKSKLKKPGSDIFDDGSDDDGDDDDKGGDTGGDGDSGDDDDFEDVDEEFVG
jgi:hypothetical protein